MVEIMSGKTLHNPLMRLIWAAFGGICVVLAMAGAVLPLLPTTPFLLLAAFAFARSSTRLHSWLISHKRFGPLIADWRDHGAISRRTKRISVGVMAAMPLASYGLGAPLWAIAVQAVALTGSAGFILSRPDAPR